MRITLGYYYSINTGIIWGGSNTGEPQCGDVLLKILLNAGTSSIFGFIYVLFLILLIINVKIIMTRGQPAGVRSISTSEASQRLHAGDLNPNYITGFCDGDASFHISRTPHVGRLSDVCFADIRAPKIFRSNKRE